jgi:sporulation protein YlmC with PRC-barrel domain
MSSTLLSQPILSSDTLKGEGVRNPAGDHLGKIEDFMLDMETGRIRYAVMSFGGLMGFGNKLFAVPPEALTIDTDHKCLVLNVDQQRLNNAPGFDNDNWPYFADASFVQWVYQYYGHRPYWV